VVHTLVDAVIPACSWRARRASARILQILVGQSDEELLRLAYDPVFGLQAAVFTRSLTRAFRYWRTASDWFGGGQRIHRLLRGRLPSVGRRAPVPAGATGRLAPLRDMTDMRTVIVTLS